MSADKTYPIFVTKVTRGTAGDYVGWAVGYKWGYASPDTMPVTWWGDASLQRHVSRQFFFWHEVGEFRFEPQRVAVPMPLAIQAKCRFLPLQTVELTYNKKDEFEADGMDAWTYTAIAVAISERHAVWQLQNADSDAVNIRSDLLNSPTILTDVWSN